MRQIREMSNDELRAALATASPDGWVDVRRDGKGKLVGNFCRGLSFAPEQIPNWTGDIAEAMKLEDAIRGWGLVDAYIQNLSDVTCADDSCEGRFRLAHATARQRSEAAIAAIRSVAAVQHGSAVG